ncbi:Plasmid stabilization system protein [compost metagenome]
METFHITITEPAERDLRDIADYIAHELLDHVAARKLVSRIAESIFELEHMPLRNNLVRDERLASQGIRKLVVDQYIVFYLVSEADTTVTVIRILYGKRNWRDLL